MKKKNLKINLLFLAILFLALFGGAKDSSAATYYVAQEDPAASDSNPGTEAFPWLTLDKATQTVVAGDTVIVKAGTYTDTTSINEDLAHDPTNSGTSDNPIIFRAAVPREPIIVRPDSGKPAWGIDNKSYIVIDGFTTEGLIKASHSSYVTVKNCEVTKGSTMGADASLNWGITISASDHCLVQNNYVHDLESSGNNSHNTAAIMVGFGENHTTEYNIIEHNTADANYPTAVCSAFGMKGGEVHHNIWRYNVAENAHDGFLSIGATDYTLWSNYNQYYGNLIINSEFPFRLEWNTDYPEIYNNTAYGGITRFIDGFEESDGARAPHHLSAYNNIAYDPTHGYWRAPPAASWTEFIDYSDYNDFYSASYIATYNWGGAHYTGISDWQAATTFDDNSITADPLFVNAASGDFHLQAGSPCRGAGRNGEDIGAYATGTETIGHDWIISADTTAPAPPQGLSVI